MIESTALILLAGLVVALHRKCARQSAMLLRSQSREPALKQTIALLTDELADARVTVQHLLDERDAYVREAERMAWPVAERLN